MKFVVYFDNELILTYKLNHDVSLVESWIEKISMVTVNDLCKINHKICLRDNKLTERRITRLYELADILNSVIPNSIQKESISKDNWQDALNKMHVHFPNIHKDNSLAKYYHVASEYNDIIHWLEHELRNTDDSKFRIFLDFNKCHQTNYSNIPTTDYKYFTPYIGFGDLAIHYCHIGRFSAELFYSNDLTCPADQFVPHSRFNASCILSFTNNFFQDQSIKQAFDYKWETFYLRRGGKDFFGYDIDDPDLRFGLLKFGELETINYKNYNLEFEDINAARNIIKQSNIEYWKIM